MGGRDTAGYLLSPQQQLIADRSGIETEPLTLVAKWTGPQSADALRSATLIAYQKHEILRTHFRNPGEQFVVEPSAEEGDLHFSVIDPVENASPEDLILNYSEQALSNRKQEKLWQVIYCPISPVLGYLGITMDRMLADWESLTIVLNEIGAARGASDAIVEGDPFQYADYATWQEDCRQQSATSPAALAEVDFPIASPPSDVPGHSIALIEGVNTECFAACFTVLGRLFGADHFSLGVIRDGRSLAETKGMIGPTEKTFRFSGALTQSFESVVESFQKLIREVDDAFDHTFPDNDSIPAISYQKIQLPESLHGDDWQLEPVRIREHRLPANCIRIFAVETNNTLLLHISTKSGFLDASAQKFTDFLSKQIESLVAPGKHRSDQPLTSILLGPESAALSEAIEVVSRPSVLSMFRHQVEEAPDAMAISRLGEEWTYRELWNSCRGIARLLQSREMKPGDVVAISGTKSFGWISSILGTLLADGVILTLDPSLPGKRRSRMCREVQVSLLLAVGDREVDFETESIRTLRISSSGEIVGDSVPVSESFANEAEQATTAAAYIFFTSGTTGTPKKVTGNHRGLAHFIQWQGLEFGVSSQDRVAQLTSSSFDVFLRDIFLPLCHGGTLCLPPENAVGIPQMILEWIHNEKITILHLVPSIVEWWLNGRSNLPTLPSLQIAFFAGEPLSASLVTHWKREIAPDSQVINLYGPTETTLAKCFYRVPTVPDEGVQPIGFPLPGAQAFLWNAGNAFCMTGEEGEILIRTPYRASLKSGFFQNPFRDDPEDLIYRTGDLGRLRFDGTIDILGRVDDQFKVRGVRISPTEIEAAITTESEIDQCCVLPLKKGSKLSLAAFLVSSQPDTVDVETVRGILQKQLPAAMVPEKFVVLSEIPLTANGKTDRKALRALSEKESEQMLRSLKKPENEEQKIILGIWCDLFGRNDLGISDHFFDLGGHSLLAAQLTARLRETFGRLLPMGLIFDAPTIEELEAQLVGFPIEPGLSGPRTKEDATESPLSHSQMRLWFQHRLDPVGDTYHLPIAVRINGHLEQTQLRECLNFLIQRHSILRTVFAETDGSPVQRILHQPKAELDFEDLTHLNSGEQTNALAERAIIEAGRAFDMEVVPPLRFFLIRLREEGHILLINMHHLIGDGWSSVLFLRELEACFCDHEAAGLGSSLKALPFQYSDFARWEQAQEPTSNARSSQLEYWKNRLKSNNEFPLFPTDIPREKTPDHEAREITLRLSFELSESIRRIARKENSTLFMAVLAAIHGFLNHLTGRKDFIVGTPIANRPIRETESLIGCFINTLPLRGHIDNRASFRQLLRETRTQVLADFENQVCPYEEIVRVASPKRIAGVNPLFQILLNVLNFDPLREQNKALKFERAFLAVPQSKFDWTIYVREAAEIEFQFIFNKSLFNEDKMQARVSGFREFFEYVCKEPDLALCSHQVAENALFSNQSITLEKIADAATPAPPTIREEEISRIQAAIADIWSRSFLEEPPPGLDDNFFALGGHSMLAMEISYEIGRKYDVVIPLRWMLEYPTVRRISAPLANLIWNLNPGSVTDETFEI